MKKDLNWMSGPFAHRGLHDVSKGIVENTPSAVQASLDQQLGFEIDLRFTSDGSVMVFHDDTLERLTHETGLVADKTLAELQKVRFKNTSDKMMSLQNLLELVEGRVPMLLELKSGWRLDDISAQHFVVAIIMAMKDYKGNYAIMSFDPRLIIHYRKLAPTTPRGLISERFLDGAHWSHLSLFERLHRRFLLSFRQSRPDFIAYDIESLPAIAPIIARSLFHRPLLTWTVRSGEQQKRARKYCDAMVFEGFRPTKKQQSAMI